MCNKSAVDPCGRSMIRANVCQTSPLTIPISTQRVPTMVTSSPKTKEVSFLKKLKSRFSSDVEFIGAMLEMLDEEMICQDSFMEIVREIAAGKTIAKKTTVATSGCR